MEFPKLLQVLSPQIRERLQPEYSRTDIITTVMTFPGWDFEITDTAQRFVVCTHLSDALGCIPRIPGSTLKTGHLMNAFVRRGILGLYEQRFITPLGC